jgi:hypothetical protein
MVRPLARLSVVLSLLLAAQWGMAFAHCLAPLGRAALYSVEICTAHGVQSLVVGEDGQPAAPASETHDGCPLCPGGVAPAMGSPVLPAAPVAYRPEAPASPAGLPPSPARAPPQQPRAPPTA